MLTKEQIIPFLNTCIRSYTSPSKYSSISPCHRLVALALLRRHYRSEVPRGVTCMYDVLPFSPETIRRAVKDGVDMGVVEIVRGGDKRYKKIQASKLLVETFEEKHVESTE